MGITEDRYTTILATYSKVLPEKLLVVSLELRISSSSPNLVAGPCFEPEKFSPPPTKQCTYNEILRRVRLTIFSAEKKKVLNSVCVCVFVFVCDL